jgi:DNA-binding IclR family transcriptional regulator
MRAFQILEYLAVNGEASFSDLLRALKLPRSTAFHQINTFLEAGYIRHLGNGRYRLSGKIHELSNIVVSRFDLRPVALPIMRRLSLDTGLGVNLGLLVGGEAVYAAKVDSDSHLLSTAWIGKPLSLMGSSLGKALMAWREEEEIRELLSKNPLPQVTERTQTDADAYLAGLEKVRREGIAWDNEEVTPGVSCLAAAVRDGQRRVIAAVSCSAATYVFTDKNIPHFMKKLLEAVRDIERRM